MDAEIWDAEVAGHTQVELHADMEAGVARGRIEQHREPMCDQRMGDAGSRNHVVDTPPHLVVPIAAHVVATLEQLFQLGGQWIEDQRAHRAQAYLC